MNKDTLLNALNDYLLHIQLDSIGDITSKINAVEACENYVAAIDGDVVNADWVKSNCIIILPAITCYRKTLKDNIDEAKLSGDEEALSELRTEYRDLQSYLDLLKPFKKFFACMYIIVSSITDTFYDSLLPINQRYFLHL